MPTYQYRCVDCGAPLEAVQKFTDDALTECPNCGGTLRKVFSAVGVVFKGSGFYATDSRAKGKQSGSGSESGKQAAGSPSGKDAANGTSSGKGDAAKPATSGASDSPKAAPSSGAPAA